MANQTTMLIDVTRSYIPVAPDAFPQNMSVLTKEDAKETPQPLVAFEGYNFMPTSYGYKSYFGVSAELGIDAITSRVDHIVILQTSQFLNIAVALCEDGIWTKKASEAGAWEHEVVLEVPSAGVHKDWSYCFIDNEFFAYRAGAAAYYRFSNLPRAVTAGQIAGALPVVISPDAVNPSNAFYAVTPNFLNMKGQIGLFKAGSRLGFWDSANSIAWSSIDDYADFVPAVLTAAGSAIFSEVQGRISNILSLGDGFVVYSTKSITVITRDDTGAMQWNPYVAMKDAGISFKRECCIGNTPTTQFAYTQVGLVKLEGAKAGVIVEELGDFLRESKEPVFLTLIDQRYLFLEILDKDYLDGLVSFNVSTIPSTVIPFPANPATGIAPSILDAKSADSLAVLDAYIAAAGLPPRNPALDVIPKYIVAGKKIETTDSVFSVEPFTIAGKSVVPFPIGGGVFTQVPVLEATAYIGYAGIPASVFQLSNRRVPPSTDITNGGALGLFYMPEAIVGTPPATQTFPEVNLGVPSEVAGINTVAYTKAGGQIHSQWLPQRAVVDSNLVSNVSFADIYSQQLAVWIEEDRQLEVQIGRAASYSDGPKALWSFVNIDTYNAGGTADSRIRDYTKAVVVTPTYEDLPITVPYPQPIIRRLAGTEKTDILAPASGLTRLDNILSSTEAYIKAGNNVVERDYNQDPCFSYFSEETELLGSGVSVNNNWKSPYVFTRDGRYVIRRELKSRITVHGVVKIKNTIVSTETVSPVYRSTASGTVSGDYIFSPAEGETVTAVGYASITNKQTVQEASADMKAGSINTENDPDNVFQEVTMQFSYDYFDLNGVLRNSGQLILPDIPPFYYTGAGSVTLPGNSFLLQNGSIGPVYPTIPGALVFDLQLKKWGKMKQPYKVLVDWSPLNNLSGNTIPYETFGMQGGALLTNGKIALFDKNPIDSYIKFGKIGYYRQGMTKAEEVRVLFRDRSTGVIRTEASLDGSNVELGLTKLTEFTGVNSVVAYPSTTARWHTVSVIGTYDIKGMEFRGTLVGNR